MSQQGKTDLTAVRKRIAGELPRVLLAPGDGLKPVSDGSLIHVPEHVQRADGLEFLPPQPKLYQTLSFHRNAFMYAIDVDVSYEEKPKPNTVDIAKFSALCQAQPRTVSRKVPDAVEVITAYRAWNVKTVKRGMQLSPLGSNGKWKPKQMIVAKCDYDMNHPAPNQDCNCGIWAFKTADNLLASIRGQYKPQVIGQVSLWGRVIETENGFRAQYAYPKELWLLDNSLEELGYTYGVPVRTA